MFLRLVTFACLLLFSVQCKTAQFTQSDLPSDQLRFGRGGGFAGTFSTYVLLENGQCFRHLSSDSGYAVIDRLKGKTGRRLWREAESLPLMDYRFEHPGNMSYFIEVHSDSSVHRIVWNDQMPIDRRDVQELYQKLMAAVQP